jgi:hypothetical protein
MGCQSLGLDMGVSEPGLEALASVRTFDGTPDQVAVMLQGTLKKRNFDAVIAGKGDEVVVESKTTSGLRFALHLRRVRAEDGHDQTQVSVVWDSGSDSKVHTQLVGDLEQQGGKK